MGTCIFEEEVSGYMWNYEEELRTLKNRRMDAIFYVICMGVFMATSILLMIALIITHHTNLTNILDILALGSALLFAVISVWQMFVGVSDWKDANRRILRLKDEWNER